MPALLWTLTWTLGWILLVIAATSVACWAVKRFATDGMLSTIGVVAVVLVAAVAIAYLILGALPHPPHPHLH